MRISQSSRIKNNKKPNKSQAIPGEKKPQIRGITIKVYKMTPKKPNSALRKVAKVKILSGIKKNKEIIAYIPGISTVPVLGVMNQVLLIPVRTKDLPGVKYRIIRGKLDCK